MATQDRVCVWSRGRKYCIWLNWAVRICVVTIYCMLWSYLLSLHHSSKTETRWQLCTWKFDTYVSLICPKLIKKDETVLALKRLWDSASNSWWGSGRFCETERVKKTKCHPNPLTLSAVAELTQLHGNWKVTLRHHYHHTNTNCVLSLATQPSGSV